MAKTRRRFKMDEKLLFDTIKRQAGTLEKANVEGVMNSIEAGATAVKISLLAAEGTPGLMVIEDDGKGFRDEQEVADFFETFGKPHDETNEKIIWKQFRMGRGQMFAYGKNTWRTGQFKMIVDIKEWGLDYEFEDGLPHHQGCEITIELYDNPIGNYPYYSMASYKEAIQKQVKFVEIPVYFNQEQINTAPADCSWDKIDNCGYYLFNVGTDMSVYNLGVFVMKIPASKAGMGGIVVSKQMLEVNFARNDVDSKCEIMKHLNDVIRENRIKKTRQRRRTLDRWERQATLTDVRDGQQDLNDVKTLALIPTAQGKHVSLDFIRKNRQQWCFADKGSDLADRMMERGQALCIDASLITDLNYTGHKSGFFSWLTGTDTQYAYGSNAWKKVEALYADYDYLSSTVSDEYTTLSDKKLTVVERRILKVLNSFGCWDGRVINLGYSERANAWTNGCTYVTIDRSYLKRLSVTYPAHCNKLMVLLAHEMAHDCDTRGSHVHGPEFYENMVRILESTHAPTIYNATFHSKMNSSKIDEKQAKIIKKQQKDEAKVEKKLNIAASTAS